MFLKGLLPPSSHRHIKIPKTQRAHAHKCLHTHLRFSPQHPMISLVSDLDWWGSSEAYKSIWEHFSKPQPQPPMEPSSRGVAQGQEAGTATSLVCFCWVGVGHASFCLQGLWWKEFPLHALSIHPRKSPHSPLQQPPSLIPQCLPSIPPYGHDLQLVLMCFLGIDFHELRLVPILSVGAITIRLWIISLDHCFPVLCWLGAIHLPPPPESQPLLNCPVPLPSSSLSPAPLPPPPRLPTPVTPHDPHLSSFAPQHVLKSKLSSSQSWRWVFIGHSGLRKSPLWFFHPHTPLPQWTDRWHILGVICERSHKMTNKGTISPQTALHSRGWRGRYEEGSDGVSLSPKGHEQSCGAAVQRSSSRPPPPLPPRNNMFWFVAFASWQCAKIVKAWLSFQGHSERAKPVFFLECSVSDHFLIFPLTLQSYVYQNRISLSFNRVLIALLQR